MNSRKYNEAFLREIERLNPGQREAVEHIEGPVLVIAGPGTGKTHILAARIGRILMETDTQPHNILCLTFTDAGVQAMRRRLAQLIGPESHRVHIFTFHSFCNKIIRDNLERFGRRDLEPLSDLERVEIIRKILDELPFDHPLKKGRSDIYFYENHLQNLFRRMKSENWTADFVVKKVDEYLADLPQREEYIYKVSRGKFKKGELRQAKFDEAVEKMERLKTTVALFPRYEKLMQEGRRYDYEDMILWVLRAFEKHPALLRNYQEQYLYFLVDEYQDTNGAQNEVLHRLVEYWDNPNLFIVGDDDQSIYEFQGARLKNITDFYGKYQESLRLVVLKDNYRSSQHILDTSRALISQNEIRIANNLKELGIEKILTAQHFEFAAVAVRPEIVEYPNRLQEEVDVTERIEKLRREGFPLDEIAIIFAKHRQARRLIELFEKKNLPYRTRRPVNALDLPLILNVRMLLEYLQAEFLKPYSGEHWLFRILHFRFLKIPTQDLAKLAVALAALPKKNDRPFWRDVLSDKAFLKKAGLKKNKPFLEFSAFIEDMLGDFANLSTPVFIERLINQSGLLRHVLEQPEKDWLLQVLFAFMGFVKKEADRSPRISLSRLLDIMRSMDANRISVPVQPFAAESALPQEGGLPEIDHRQKVNLLTAHGSKGLEFQKVFILDGVKDNWEPSARGGNYEFSFPDTLTLSGEEDALEARRRLFYVAMTRAKESLRISYAAQNEDGKPLQRAVFIDEIISDTEVAVQELEAENDAVLNAQTLLLLETKPSPAAVEAALKDSVRTLLDNFSLSVSSMNKYLRCPLSFYYENVLNVPVVAREAAYFGIAMHNALCRGFEKMLATKQKLFPSPEMFVRYFGQEMERQQGFFSKKEFERRWETGSQNLHEYVKRNAPNWQKDVKVEQEFNNVEMDGVPLTGVIDRIDFLDKTEAHIADYKTGSHDSSKLQKPSEKNPYGGTYWRQLVFYKILFENWRTYTYIIRSAEISYLEPDAKGNFPQRTITFEPEDVFFVKNLIRETYGKIMRQEFYEGCGESNCPWCSFLKNNGEVASFSAEEVEELDD